MTVKALYKSKLLDCWPKAVELRDRHIKEALSAKEKGKLLMLSSTDAMHAPYAGFPNIVRFQLEAWGIHLGRFPEQARRCAEVAEAAGYGKDFCGYARLFLGSLIANINPYGGDVPRPDFAAGLAGCQTVGKWFNEAARISPMLNFVHEEPINIRRFNLKKHVIDFLMEGYFHTIEFIEKVSGEKLDEERFIEATYDQCTSYILWAQICLLNQTIPAPLNLRWMYTLFVPAHQDPCNKDTIELYRMLKDEVEDRVKNQIAALSTERFRLLHFAQPPTFFMELFKVTDAYGAVFVGSPSVFTMASAFSWKEDGALYIKQHPREAGVVLKNKENAVRLLAEWRLSCAFFQSYYFLNRIKDYLYMMKAWHADGAVMHIDRSCQGQSMGLIEIKNAFQREGLRTTHYEGTNVDPRDFDTNQVIDRLEAYLESLGLERVERRQ